MSNSRFDFDRHFARAERNSGRLFAFGVVVWGIFALASLTLTGVIIWGIVKAVQHFF